MVCLCSLRSLKVPALQHSRRIRTGPTIQYMWANRLLAKLRSNKVLKKSENSHSYVETPSLLAIRTAGCPLLRHVHAFSISSILSSDIPTAPAFTDLRFAASIAASIQSCGFATTILSLSLWLPLWLSPMLDWCLNTSSWSNLWEHSVSDQPTY